MVRTSLSRSLVTISCRDTDRIPKVPEAGKVVLHDGERVQVMHNGVKVVFGGYYGDWMAHIIRGLNGHHEPQEELIFHTLMRYVRNRSLIVELGSFWAYYTQWYLTEIPDSIAICVEPDAKCLEVGRRNSQINGTTDRVRFINAWTGGERQASCMGPGTTANPVELPMLDLPAILEECPCKCVELLHMDVQGVEVPLLRSIDAKTAQERLRFVMASTHMGPIADAYGGHRGCVDRLGELGATVLVEHSVEESFSGDGLILASFHPGDRDLWFPEISRCTFRW